MKHQLTILLSLIFSLNANSQTYYQGFERMCWTNNQGKLHCYDSPRKWFHLNTIFMEGDSIFQYKIPVQIRKKDTIFSASDGAFFYYYGQIKQLDSLKIAYLASYNCDYCGMPGTLDSISGFFFPLPRLDTLKVKQTKGNLLIGNVIYKKLENKKNLYFPSKKYFYFDSNSISRRDPKGQYELISQAIKNFLQTKKLTLDNDTLKVCIERYDFFERDSLMEALDPDSLHIDTTGIHFAFYTRSQLNKQNESLKKIIRYIQIDEIIDHWKAARIELTYKILVPKTIHKFREGQYGYMFSYIKVGNKYELKGDLLTENSWELVEQR